MAIFDLFSKRQKELKGEKLDVYIYDKIPEKLRVQIIHIITDTFGRDIESFSKCSENSYKFIYDALCREYGRFNLIDGNHSNYKDQVLDFILITDKIEEVLDVLELFLLCINVQIKKDYRQYSRYTEVELLPDLAIIELNYRFKENGIGYLFENSQIIRIDSTYIHSELTKPTISLLLNKKFTGPNEEYLKAHKYYKEGKNKECLTECLKAFESTIKVICIEKGWDFNQRITASGLIKICFNNELIPNFTQNQFTSLLNLIESGIPTIRNKLGAHGQGQVPQNVDDGITRYGLNLTGANIIFLIEQSGIN